MDIEKRDRIARAIFIRRAAIKRDLHNYGGARSSGGSYFIEGDAEELAKYALHTANAFMRVCESKIKRKFTKHEVVFSYGVEQDHKLTEQGFSFVGGVVLTNEQREELFCRKGNCEIHVFVKHEE